MCVCVLHSCIAPGFVGGPRKVIFARCRKPHPPAQFFKVRPSWRRRSAARCARLVVGLILFRPRLFAIMRERPATG